MEGRLHKLKKNRMEEVASMMSHKPSAYRAVNQM